MNNDKKNTASIRDLNDRFRCQGIGRGRLMITRGIEGEGDAFVARTLAAVRAFDAFTPDNDPHLEHDFGQIEIADHKIFWKFDYYDLSLEWGSENPADENQTVRVLTVMLAEEY